MGYRISQVDSEFRIKKENQEPAFQAVKLLMSDNGYHWVSAGWKKGLRDIYSVLEYWGYQPEIDDLTGDIIELNSQLEKMGDEIQLFKVIAPYVEKGSFLHMAGEDHAEWRWEFDGTTCTQIFEEDEEAEDYDVSLDTEFKDYADQINARLRDAAKLIKEANNIASQAGLPSLIDSMYTKEDMNQDEADKFEQRIRLIDVDAIEIAIGQSGWSTSSAYC